jgi:hypothetical protein
MSEVWKRLLQSLSPLQICWLCLLSTVGGGIYAVNTFARDSDVSSIRVELLQDRLLELRIRQCDAVKAFQPADFFAKQITEQAGKYQELTNAQPNLPTCQEL